MEEDQDLQDHLEIAARLLLQQNVILRVLHYLYTSVELKMLKLNHHISRNPPNTDKDNGESKRTSS